MVQRKLCEKAFTYNSERRFLVTNTHDNRTKSQIIAHPPEIEAWINTAYMQYDTSEEACCFSVHDGTDHI